MISPPNEDNLITPGDLILIYLDIKRQYLVQAAEKLNLSSDLGNMDLSETVKNTTVLDLQLLILCLK
jgi:hypothetical protein